jgi:hypothetical protein
MIVKRREFIKRSLSFGGISLAQRRLLGSFAPSRAKSILVLGGTSYLGPQIISAALNAGHQVTLFNRGITNPQMFPSVKKLRGFRSIDSKQQHLTSLRSGRWDAVVYDGSHFAEAGTTEDASLCAYDGNENDYESGKAEGERRLHEIVGGKLTVVRPGSIEGKHAGDEARRLQGSPAPEGACCSLG